MEMRIINIIGHTFEAACGIALIWMLLPLPPIPPNNGSLHAYSAWTVVGLFILMGAVWYDNLFRRPRS